MVLCFGVIVLEICAITFGAANPVPPPTDKCGKNAEFLECGSACVPTCKNTRPSPSCIKMCVPGCFCKEGYLKAHNQTGECVPLEECQSVLERPKGERTGSESQEISQCRRNEEFLTCGLSCTPTCDKPHRWCSLRCNTPGCYCKPGFVKNGDGDCVAYDECGAL